MIKKKITMLNLSITAFHPFQIDQLIFPLCITIAHGKLMALKLLKLSRFKMPISSPFNPGSLSIYVCSAFQLITMSPSLSTAFPVQAVTWYRYFIILQHLSSCYISLAITIAQDSSISQHLSYRTWQ